MTKLTNTFLAFNEAKTVNGYSELSVSGVKVDYSGAEDSKVLILFENTSAEERTVTVLAGDSIQGINDLELTLSASATSAVALESGRFMFTTGENLGCVVLKADSAGVKALVIELP